MNLINVYLDINPVTNKPFYVGIGTMKRCLYKFRSNIYHQKIVASLPNNEYKRIILYKDIPEEKAYRIEKQIIKRCGKIVNNSGFLANIHDGGQLDSASSVSHYTRGHKMRDIYGEKYKHHQEGKPFLYMYDDENLKSDIIKKSREKMKKTKQERVEKYGKTEGELNNGKNKQRRIREKGFTEKELDGFKRSAAKNRGRTMKEATGNPDWVCWRKGKSHKELFGNDYVNPRKSNSHYNTNYICVQCEPFKLVINGEREIYCLNEEEFSKKTKLHNRVIRKLKKEKTYYIKRRQHNTLHDFNPKDTLEYFPITIEEYKITLTTTPSC